MPAPRGPSSAFVSALRSGAARFRERTGVSWWVPFAVCVATYFFLHSDPFGLDAALEARSTQVTLRARAPFYAPSGRVVAVLIDDAYLTDRGVSWPLTYQQQGGVMRRILAAEPALLFVDLIYPHRHSDRLGDPITGLTGLIDDHDVPIVFPMLAKEPRPTCEAETDYDPVDALDWQSTDADLLGWIVRNPERRRVAVVNWSGCGGRYPLYFGASARLASPAFEALRTFCEKHSTDEACVDAQPATRAAQFAKPMVLLSGAYPPAHQKFSFGEGATGRCQPLADESGHVPLLTQLRDMARQVVYSVFGDPRESGNPAIALPCPTVTIVSYADLARASAEERSTLLKDKLVLLGTSLDGVPDVIATSVHGQVAGVVWHAMALDNLLSLRTGYLHEPPSPLGSIVMFMLALLFALTFALGTRSHRSEGFKRGLAFVGLMVWIGLAVAYAWEEPKYAVTALMIGAALDLLKPTYSATYVSALLVALLVSGMLTLMHMAPVNFLSFVLSIAAIAHTVKPYFKGESVKEFPHHLSVLGAGYRMITGKKGVPHAQR